MEILRIKYTNGTVKALSLKADHAQVATTKALKGYHTFTRRMRNHMVSTTLNEWDEDCNEGRATLVSIDQAAVDAARA